jgi:hypothetical protein
VYFTTIFRHWTISRTGKLTSKEEKQTSFFSCLFYGAEQSEKTKQPSNFTELRKESGVWGDQSGWALSVRRQWHRYRALLPLVEYWPVLTWQERTEKDPQERSR